MLNDIVEDMLNFDPLDTAEKTVGKGDEASSLGFALMKAKGKILEDELKGNDTYFGMTWQEFKNLMSNSIFGFKNVMMEKFHPTGHRDAGDPTTPPDEEFGCWVDSKRGLVLFAGSYLSYWDKDEKKWHQSLSSGHVYFQYEMTEKVYRDTKAWANVLNHTSGGTYLKSNPQDRYRDVADDEVLIFERDLDIREALIHKLLNLDLGPGKFVAPWHDCAWVDKDGSKHHRFMWPLNYSETEDDSKIDKIRNQKLAALPKVVHDIMGF